MSDGDVNETGNGGAQEELPLEQTEMPILRVSPGMAVSSEHLDKLGGADVAVVDGIGPMEVWASYGLVFRDRSEGTFSKKRVGWDEARRLQELVREVGWEDSKVDARTRIEQIAGMPNGDILSAAEALAEVDVESRDLIHARCSEVIGAHAGALSLVNAVGAAAQVRNDDIRTPREVIEMTLWLMSQGEEDAEGDLLAWLLSHEEAGHGLTGLVSACDEFYKEVTGSRPSSTLQSRSDRCSALRFRMSVTDSTPVTPALKGEYELEANEEGSEDAETSAVDEMSTTLVDLPRIPESSEEDEPLVGSESSEAAEQEDTDSTSSAPAEVPVALAVDESPEDRLDRIERQLAHLDDKLTSLLDSPASFGEGSGGKAAPGIGVIGVMIAIGVVASVAISSWASGPGVTVDSGEAAQVAPRVSEDFAKANFPEEKAEAEADEKAEPSGIGEEAEEKGPEVPELVEREQEDSPERVSVEKGEIPADEPAVEPNADDVPPAPIQEIEESASAPAAALEEEPSLEKEEVPSSDEIEEAPPVVEAKKEERVAEKYGLGFKATHRLTKRTKLFRYGSRDFVEVTDLPGGDALVDECIVAKAPRSRFRHKIYKGYQTIYLSCAGEMKVICERLGCEPQQRCITAAGWVKKCK